MEAVSLHWEAWDDTFGPPRDKASGLVTFVVPARQEIRVTITLKNKAEGISFSFWWWNLPSAPYWNNYSTCIDAPVGHYLAADHVQFVRHTFLQLSVDYEPCKRLEKKMFEEILRFLEALFFPEVSETDPSWWRTSCCSCDDPFKHMWNFFPPKTELIAIWMFNKPHNIFNVD